MTSFRLRGPDALLRTALVGLVLFASATGCSASDDAASSDESEIINGKFAKEKTLNAVGRLRVDGNAICTATLIAPQLVLTARHCLFNARRAGLSEARNYFIVEQYIADNSHGASREAIYPIRAEVVLGPKEGGALGLGRDVALLMLNEPVPADVAKPFKIRERMLDASDVGRVFTEVGYGVGGRQNWPGEWLRTKGPATLDSVGGKPYKQAFESKEALDAYVASIEGEGTNVDVEYESALDDALDEAHVGLVPGGGAAPKDSQACKGDSGGPILDRVGDNWEIVGVISTGELGVKVPCYLGTVIATTAPVVQELVAKSAGATPWLAFGCNQGDPADYPRDQSRSACSEDVMSTCSSETYYRSEFQAIVVDDCAARGLICQSASIPDATSFDKQCAKR